MYLPSKYAHEKLVNPLGRPEKTNGVENSKLGIWRLVNPFGQSKLSSIHTESHSRILNTLNPLGSLEMGIFRKGSLQPLEERKKDNVSSEGGRRDHVSRGRRGMERSRRVVGQEEGKGFENICVLQNSLESAGNISLSGQDDERLCVDSIKPPLRRWREVGRRERKGFGGHSNCEPMLISINVSGNLGAISIFPYILATDRPVRLGGRAASTSQETIPKN
jgi:hypothetical protein